MPPAASRNSAALSQRIGLISTIEAKTRFRNKISETPQPRRLCNGMKTLILDYDYELHLGGTAKSGIQKSLDSRGDLRYLCGACRLDEVRTPPSSTNMTRSAPPPFNQTPPGSTFRKEIMNDKAMTTLAKLSAVRSSDATTSTTRTRASSTTE